MTPWSQGGAREGEAASLKGERESRLCWQVNITVPPPRRVGKAGLGSKSPIFHGNKDADMLSMSVDT